MLSRDGDGEQIRAINHRILYRSHAGGIKTQTTALEKFSIV